MRRQKGRNFLSLWMRKILWYMPPSISYRQYQEKTKLKFKQKEIKEEESENLHERNEPHKWIGWHKQEQTKPAERNEKINLIGPILNKRIVTYTWNVTSWFLLGNGKAEVGGMQQFMLSDCYTKDGVHFRTILVLAPSGIQKISQNFRVTKKRRQKK